MKRKVNENENHVWYVRLKKALYKYRLIPFRNVYPSDKMVISQQDIGIWALKFW